jgi:hypothetical protein
VLRVFPSKQLHFSADTLIVNTLEYGDDLGMVLSHSNLQPIAFVEKATIPDVLLHLCCELALDACLRVWRTFSLLPGDCNLFCDMAAKLAQVCLCGSDALCVLKLKTGASSDLLSSFNSSCSFLLP